MNKKQNSMARDWKEWRRTVGSQGPQWTVALQKKKKKEKKKV